MKRYIALKISLAKTNDFWYPSVCNDTLVSIFQKSNELFHWSTGKGGPERKHQL